jgi:arylsulfatase A-like enzyme
MAEEGMRFTDFYVASSVCTPSRAALLTGCYPQRVGLPEVIGPLGPDWTREGAKTGISDKEQTIAELLKEAGYATSCFGKWHLGHYPKFLPTRHGFDEYFGLPYSNDMWPERDPDWPDLPLMEQEQVIEYNPDQSQLTTWYTERAVKFIEKNKDKPFFIYVPHSMPHVSLFVSDKFKGKSEQGLYGDVIMEIDWSVGQILNTLKRLGLDDNTLVVFTCDNGPWLSYGDHGGSAGPLREGKFTSFEGGFRVPCIIRWPGKISKGSVCGQMASTIDILPTFVQLAGAPMPKLKIDGKDIWPLMSESGGAKSPHEAFYFYRDSQLEAVRSGKWKLHFPHEYAKIIEPGTDDKDGEVEEGWIDLSLFDLENDIGERHDVSAQHPDVVKRLTALADMMRSELGDSATGIKGKNIRGPGRV